jgi:hypothetical protein
VDQALDACQWITSPTAWFNYQNTGTPGEPQPKAVKKHSLKVPKYEPSFEALFKNAYSGSFKDVTGTLKQKTQCDQCGTPLEAAQTVCNFCGSKQKQKKQKDDLTAKVLEPRAEVVNVAPKRKFNLE